MKIVTTLTATALAAATFLVFAAPGEPGSHGARFERLKAADTNGDGMISRAEAASLPMIAKHFDEIDANRDGQLAGDELRAFHQKQREARFGEHFKQLDSNGDGRLSKAEAAKAPRISGHFDKLDANADGFLTAEELKAGRRKHHQAHGGK
jgi:Ca2+-binding EF-hand superfamily protein